MTGTQKEETVHRIFDRIAQIYDGANDRISLGLQRRWKRALIRAILSRLAPGDRVLDVCCGTGDVALALAKECTELEVTGLDFSTAMLAVARRRGAAVPNVSWQEGNALALPYPDSSFAAAAIAFGLRNTSDYRQVLSEMKRVVRPGGFLYCLDSFVPELWAVAPFYQIYFKKIMPMLGGGSHYRQEYTWLWHSTQAFLSQKQLLELFNTIGLHGAVCRSFLFGACALHTGQKI